MCVAGRAARGTRSERAVCVRSRRAERTGEGRGSRLVAMEHPAVDGVLDPLGCPRRLVHGRPRCCRTDRGSCLVGLVRCGPHRAIDPPDAQSAWPLTVGPRAISLSKTVRRRSCSVPADGAHTDPVPERQTGSCEDSDTNGPCGTGPHDLEQRTQPEHRRDDDEKHPASTRAGRTRRGRSHRSGSVQLR